MPCIDHVICSFHSHILDLFLPTKMEFASYSTSHNITEMACKFAKAFKHKSLGVFFSHTNPQKLQSNGEFYTEKKVHPQPKKLTRDHILNKSFDIEDVFEAISMLKLAYVNLQNAHLPYDPFKIKSADECIILQLEKLSKMKCSFDKLMRIKKAESDSCQFVHVNLRFLDELESEIKARETRIARLKKEVQDLSLSNTKMIEELSSINKGSIINVSLFEEIYGGVSNAIRDFAKLIILLMRDSNWDLDCAAESIEKSVAYSKESHKKYAFQAFVGRRMFLHLFSSNSHGNESVDQNFRFEDPINALIEEPNSPFADFCISKYLLVIHPKMEASFFGNLDHRNMICKGKHPRTAFYQAFVKMAKWVWILREIAVFVKPKMQIFGVQRGSEFCGEHMESVTNELDSCNELKVELMVMPGFRIGNAIVKCKVYVSKIKS